jgi:hypothetical protein
MSVLKYTSTTRYKNNITRGTWSSQDLYAFTDPNTDGYSEHVYYQHT